MATVAQLRAEHFSSIVSGKHSRPSQRSSAARPTGVTVPKAAIVPLTAIDSRALATDGSNTVKFSGIASVYEQGYAMSDSFGDYTEIVAAGAGAKSLAAANLDVPLVLQHDSMRRIASTVNGSLILSETPQGLMVEAPALDMQDLDVQYIVPKLRSGLIHEMSFRFTIISGEWSPDYTQFRIKEYDINRGDVSIVGFGANPATTAELRAKPSNLRPRVSDGTLLALRSLRS